MKPGQFSLRSFLVAVAFCAVAIAALLNASEAWLAGVATVTIGLFMVEALVAIYCPGARRAFAVGFLVWGAIYFAVHNFLLAGYSSSVLGTAMILQLAFEGMHPETSASIRSHSGFALGHYYELYMHIGEFLWTLVLGGCGGLLARMLWQRKLQQTAGRAIESSH